MRGRIEILSGVTGAANQWVRIALASPSRLYFSFQNISDTAMELGVGTPENVRLIRLVPVNTIVEYTVDKFISSEEVYVRCIATGRSYIAFQNTGS